MHRNFTLKLGIATAFTLFVIAAAAFRADQSLARLAGLNESAPAIQSQEVALSAAELAGSGALDGVQLTPTGLALAPGLMEGSVTSAPIASPLGFTTDIVPLWQASVPEGAEIALETRLSIDGGQTWSNWLASPEAYYPVRDNFTSGNLVWAGSQNVSLQVRVSLRGTFAGASPELSQLVLVFNDTSAGPSDSEIAGQSMRVASSDAVCPAEKPAIVSRTNWGNPEGQNSPRRLPRYAPVTHVIVHQTETPNNTAPYHDYAGWVRSVWNFHANVLGWGDVGYNYLIDPNGVIYEGRAGGDDVIGIHDTHNAGSLGLGLLGCYGNCDDPRLTVAQPSEAMLSSAASLMAWKLGQQGIDPLSSGPYGGLSNIPAIAGGRDVVSTSAPGDNVYNQLPNLRSRAADKTNCNGSTPTLTPTATVPLPPTATATAPAIQACQVTGIIFNKESYLPGEPMYVTVRLADAAGVPLVGANINSEVTRSPLEAAASTGFGLVDRAGDYDGVYTQTELTGWYTFKFTASDPTGQRFLPCTALTAVLVAEAGYETPTPIPTEITETPVPTGTIPAGTPTPTATTAPGDTATPTNTPETPEPTATPTNTPETPVPTDTPTETPSPTPTATTEPVQGTAVKVDPATQTINVCTTNTSVTVAVQQVENMAAVQLELVYNPAVVQVIDANPGSDGVQITVDPVFSSGFVAQNEVDTVAGRVSFAATLLGSDKIDGDTGLIQVDFEPVAAGSSSLTLENVILASTAGQPIDHQLVAGAITVVEDCGSSGASGVLQLQGRTDHSGIVVTSETGEQAVTASDGSFSIAASGPLMFEHPGFLPAQSGLPTSIQAGDFAPVTLGVITLLAGDTSGDGQINILDLAYIAQQYGTTDALADLNGDGKVDILDIVLAAGNFGQVGPMSVAQ